MATPTTEAPVAPGSADTDVPSKYTWYADLKTDGKSIANQAVWNAALLYPMYMYDIDNKIFGTRDGDLVSAMKLAGLVAGVTEAQKLIRRTLKQAGVSPKVTHPFGVPL